jgi:hypothetical protein
MPQPTNPIHLTAAGEELTKGVRILAIVWDAASTSGDTVQLDHRNGGGRIWNARTDTTQTYLGLSLSPHGISAPEGFVLTTLSSGQVLVYLAEA